MTRGHNNRALSILEYVVLLTIIIAGLVAMGPYILNALNGYFVRAGEEMSYRRQHDPYLTRDCIWDPLLSVAGAQVGDWYSAKCFDHERQKLGCNAVKADNLDMFAWCRLNATDFDKCTGDVLGTCPTTCCMTEAKDSCLAPCNTMPTP